MQKERLWGSAIATSEDLLERLKQRIDVIRGLWRDVNLAMAQSRAGSHVVFNSILSLASVKTSLVDKLLKAGAYCTKAVPNQLRLFDVHCSTGQNYMS